MNETIEQIIGIKQIAVVGVSDKKMGGAIYKELKQRGYSVYPVHPTRKTFEGDACHATLRTVPAEVKAAVVAVSPKAAEALVEDALAAGITHLWFQQGPDFSDVVAKAKAKGFQTVSRKCILMYAPPVTSIHKFHRFFVKLFGRY
jgi:predicted CoA-binding protein